MSKSYRVETTQQVVIGFVLQKGSQTVNGHTFRVIGDRVISDPASETAAKKLALEDGYHLVGADHPHPLIDPLGAELFDAEGNPITALSQSPAVEAFIKGLRENVDVDDTSAQIQILKDELAFKTGELKQIREFASTLKEENARLKDENLRLHQRVVELESLLDLKDDPSAPSAPSTPSLPSTPAPSTPEDNSSSVKTEPTPTPAGEDLSALDLDALKATAKELGLEVRSNYNKATLIGMINTARAAN